MKRHVLALFRASLDEGTLPSQWRHTKIIPLKKPGKDDYTLAKAWRPISLLATLGKVLESVIADVERIEEETLDDNTGLGRAGNQGRVIPSSLKQLCTIEVNGNCAFGPSILSRQVSNKVFPIRIVTLNFAPPFLLNRTFFQHRI
ncbi:hypothetical protein CLAIMM_08559, partial [Cladophialophora immunda]